jgi:hypothetical protein
MTALGSLEKPGIYPRFRAPGDADDDRAGLYDEMLKLYPDWINRGALWSSVLAVKTSV